MTSAFSWQNSISLCPASFHILRPNLPVTPGVSWLPTWHSSPRGCDGCAKVQAAATGAPSAAERCHPTSEVRGRSQEDPMPERQWPGGVTPRPRSGGAAKRRYPTSEVRGSNERSYPTSKVRGGGQEELPHAPRRRPRAAAWRSNPMTEARGSGWEDQPHVQGPVAVWAQESLEELSHVEGQEGWRWGDTPCPR